MKIDIRWREYCIALWISTLTEFVSPIEQEQIEFMLTATEIDFTRGFTIVQELLSDVAY